MTQPVTVRFMKLEEGATLPCYAHSGDAGMDLVAFQEVSIPAGDAALVRTGLSIQLPPGTEAQVRPRSGLALKRKVTVLNTPGTIDEGYRGEIGVILINHGKEDFIAEKGMKIAQLVIKPVLRVEIEEADSLTETARGIGGFGSSGV
ncbi:MAG: dUTP diphosphatase [Candidatus Methylumidiphilus alinenensis]|uniref:Deoxyuridine 5'-triphosphate nucleotidohydrolase n=1 Tax=Candidatus Methylumidiphilus alinenensis TaxID=2202197 RepID=A0A2W4QSE0_9GAMM|nr:MAG: dUTP diphosphatase [Candidatus Methylumidiphilus alinenensis]